MTCHYQNFWISGGDVLDLIVIGNIYMEMETRVLYEMYTRKIFEISLENEISKTQINAVVVIFGSYWGSCECFAFFTFPWFL